MLLLNFLPLGHLALTVTVPLLIPASWPTKIGLAVICLYILPPLLCRLFLVIFRVSEGTHGLGSRAFLGWWASFQCQVLFGRWPALEELLRLFPGLYSLWLRLWGARIGRLTYWSAGTLLTDRSFLTIGDDVVLAAGVRLNSHVLKKDERGEMQLLLGRITIGDRAVVGGYSLLTAGTQIAADEATRAFLISPPGSIWQDGKRVRTNGAEDSE